MISQLCRRFALILAVFAVLPAAPALAIANVRDSQQGLPDLDARTGSVVPSAAQKQTRVEPRRARDLESLRDAPVAHQVRRLPRDRALRATPSRRPRPSSRTTRRSSGSPTRASRTSSSSTTRRWSAATPTRCSSARRSADLPATQDGLITVGVVDGKVAYVSSSSAGDGNVPAAAILQPQAAWIIAAANVGYNLSIVDLSAGKNDNSWRAFRANGISDIQRARLTALPTPTDGVRPAYETIVLDAHNGGERARLHRLRRRRDGKDPAAAQRRPEPERDADVRVDRPRLRSSTARCPPRPPVGQCGVNGPFTAPANTQSIEVADTADVVANDILTVPRAERAERSVVRQLRRGDEPGGDPLRAGGGISAGTTFFVKTCPSPNPLGPFVDPLSYHGSIAFNDAAGTPQPPLQNTPEVARVQGESHARHAVGLPVELRVHGYADQLVLARFAEQPQLRGLELPLRGQEPRVTCPVGRGPAHGRDHGHDDREQRHDRRGVGQPAHGRRRASAADASRPRVHRHLDEPVVQQQVRPDDELHAASATTTTSSPR